MLDCFVAVLLAMTRLRALHKFGKSLGIIRMPTRQRGPVFDDVAGRPENPALVEASRHIVVRTQDVEISGVDPFDQEVNGLRRRPGSGRLLAAALCCEAGEDESGNEQMGAYPAAGRVSQF